MALHDFREVSDFNASKQFDSHLVNPTLLKCYPTPQ